LPAPALNSHTSNPGLHNSETQIDQHKLATGRKSLFRHSVEEILKGQVIIRSRAFATFSATEFSRAARKDLAGRMLCRPVLTHPCPVDHPNQRPPSTFSVSNPQLSNNYKKLITRTSFCCKNREKYAFISN